MEKKKKKNQQQKPSKGHETTVLSLCLGDPRFDVNVTTKPYIMDNVDFIGGDVNAKYVFMFRFLANLSRNKKKCKLCHDLPIYLEIKKV